MVVFLGLFIEDHILQPFCTMKRSKIRFLLAFSQKYFIVTMKHSLQAYWRHCQLCENHGPHWPYFNVFFAPPPKNLVKINLFCNFLEILGASGYICMIRTQTPIENPLNAHWLGHSSPSFPRCSKGPCCSNVSWGLISFIFTTCHDIPFSTWKHVGESLIIYDSQDSVKRASSQPTNNYLRYLGNSCCSWVSLSSYPKSGSPSPT